MFIILDTQNKTTGDGVEYMDTNIHMVHYAIANIITYVTSPTEHDIANCHEVEVIQHLLELINSKIVVANSEVSTFLPGTQYTAGTFFDRICGVL